MATTDQAERVVVVVMVVYDGGLGRGREGAD